MYFSLIKHLGPTWLVQRLWFKVEKKLGLLEKECPFNLGQPFSLLLSLGLQKGRRTKTPFLPIGRISREELAPWCEGYAIETGHSPVAEARGLAQGKIRIFHSRFFDLGYPLKLESKCFKRTTP
jgi:hypothetical protein